MPFLEASNLPSTLAGSRLVIQQYEKMFALLEQTVKDTVAAKEAADDKHMATLATHVAREREYQRTILSLHKKLAEFVRKYPQSGIKVPKKPRYALLELEQLSSDDDDNEEGKPVGKANNNNKNKNKKAAPKKAGNKRKKRGENDDDSDDSDVDDDDLSLEGGVDKGESPAITRSAIKRKQSQQQSQQSQSKAASKKKAAKASAAAAAAAAAAASQATEDQVTKITDKALAYDLPIYCCAWASGSSTWEFPCDLKSEGYGAMLEAFDKAWGKRALEPLDEELWPRTVTDPDLVPEKILEVGYCKNDTSVRVQWRGNEATWERVTDMMIHGYGKIVRKFLKKWGDKPIRVVNIDENVKEVATPYREPPRSAAVKSEKASQQVKQEKQSQSQAAAVVVKEEPQASARAATPVTSPYENEGAKEGDVELEEDVGADDDESVQASSETEQSGPSLSDHDSDDDADDAEDHQDEPPPAQAQKKAKVTVAELKKLANK